MTRRFHRRRVAEAADPAGFSEGGVIAGETTDATDTAIQQNIVSVYGK